MSSGRSKSSSPSTWLREHAREARLARADRALDDDVAALLEVHRRFPAGRCAIAREVRARARDALVAHAAEKAPREPAPGNRRDGGNVDQRAQHERALVHARVRHREPGQRGSGGGRRAADRDRACAARCAAVRGRAAGACRRSIECSAREQRARTERRAHGDDRVHVVGLRGVRADRRARVVGRDRDDARSAAAARWRARRARAAGAGGRGCCPARRRRASVLTPGAGLASGGAVSPSSRRLRPRPRERRRFFGPSSGFSIAFALVRRRRWRSGPTKRRDRRARLRARRSCSAGPGSPSRRESADARAAGTAAGPSAARSAAAATRSP